ncbi:hypothetical protein JCGZ_25601 [Jatropha curcas]|uniref:Uncharacterized protein n=1 Tax=Jatropha curcas TaxID=180498 RepID=A0A067JWD4_JATCU|nr:proline-rich protein 4 [Jatropha curcas]KDP24305.1 hypothetical protein JCGZ_25601 [Jatropha curcas]
MSCFFVIFFLCFTLNNLNLSQARPLQNLPSAVVVGTVYCDTCFQEDFSKNSRFISGASVAVECRDENAKKGFYQEVKTNNHGEFRVHLPFSVSKHVKKIKKCSVKLISSNEPYCAIASTATSSTLHLKSRKQGIHIFSAGFFSFKPQNQPNLCNQKPSIQDSKELNSQKISSIPPFSTPISNPIFPPPLEDPTIPNLPPVTQNPVPPVPTIPLLPNLPPLPQLPPLPNLPPLPPLPPLTPWPGKTTTTTSLKNNQELDQTEAKPNFFFPPPIFPPLFQPPPLFPPLLPPNPLQPAPSPLIPLPPIPGLTPSPPPPVFPFPFPFPFPPSPPPRIPGIPPAASSSSSSSSKKTSP